MECDFCNKIFSCKSSLILHQKTAKYCLKLQGKINEEQFECEHCNKKFTVKQNLISHYGICKEKEVNYKFEQREKDIRKEFEIELKEKDNEINELKQKIAELNGRLYTLKEDHEVLKEIAKQPKNTTTTNKPT